MKSFTQRWREASDEAEDQPMEDTPTDPKEAPAINTHVRLFDLVRHQRSALLHAELITEEEYGFLCAGPMAMSPKGGSPSRQRLEDYDELRAALAEQTERADRLQAGVEKDLQYIRELELKENRLTAELDAAKSEAENLSEALGQERSMHNVALAKLQAELDAVRKERDEWRKQHDTADRSHFRVLQERDAAQAKCAELEKLIQDAPHGPRCRTVTCSYYNEKEKRYVSLEQCTCWKSRLTPAPPEEKRP